MIRDDIFEYSLHNHHSEEEGQKKRKKIWFVFWVLLVVTIVEVTLGFIFSRDMSMKGFLMATFIFLTIVKAYYIVMSYMHLGDERKSLKVTILAPFILFALYLIWICVVEANYVHRILANF